MYRIDDNGIVRDMTEQEIAELERLAAEMPESEPTPEERLAALEQENIHLKEALELLLSGQTEVSGHG